MIISDFYYGMHMTILLNHRRKNMTFHDFTPKFTWKKKSTVLVEIWTHDLKIEASCAIHYAMKYLVKIIVDVNIHIKNLSLKEKSHAKISGDWSLVSQSQH